jgi:hypothetical protein
VLPRLIDKGAPELDHCIDPQGEDLRTSRTSA